MAVDGGSGRRPWQEIETVRRKSAQQSPEIRVGVAKIFDFSRFSNLFLANANQSTPVLPVPQFHLLQDKIAESSKGHFLCCETKLVNSRTKLSIVIFQKKGWPLKCQHYSDPQNKIASSITLFRPPVGWSLAQLVG